MREPAEQIIVRVCRRFDVQAEDLLGPSHAWAISRPRQRLMLELFLGGWRMSAIGKLLRRDHSTVSLGIRSAMNVVIRSADNLDHRTIDHMVIHPPNRNADTTQNSEYLLTQIGARAARDVCG